MRQFFILLAATLLPTTALAKNVSSPYVDEGVVEIESKNRYDSDHRASKDGYRRHELDVGYGVNKWLALEYTGQWEYAPGHGHRYNSTELEALIQLTPTGAYWLDAGIKAGYSFAHVEGDADSIGVKLLLAKKHDRLRHVLNLNYTQEIGADANDNPEGEIRWATRYNYIKELNPGIEYYANIGEISHSGSFDEQRHQIGPALYGYLPHSLGYELGWLVGLSDAAEDHLFKFHLKYEFAL